MTEHNLAEIRSVTVQFSGPKILREVSFTVPVGQTLAIVGESGCGKTVTLKLLAGLLAPNNGQVFFDGKDFQDFTERDWQSARPRIGFLFQGAALFDSLTVLDNIAFGLRVLKKLPETEIREIAEKRLIEVGLKPEIFPRLPAELSGGMKKRVGLARALALEPDLMLYDEPTTGLDPIMTDVINRLILQTRQARPITSVIVTHEMRTVRDVADRVVMLFPAARLGETEDQVIFQGSVEEFETATDPRVQYFREGRSQSASNY